jgi:hypothetical protein
MQLGGGGNRGCKKVPLAWRKLYIDIVYCKSKAAALKLNYHKKISISLDEKEHNALEYMQREKDTI